MSTSFDRPDFRRYPLRGILTEIAREDGSTRQSVQKRAMRGEPDTLARIAEKVRERRKKQAAFVRALR